MKANPESDLVLLNHIRECIERIREYTGERRAKFDHSRLVQYAVVRNLQTLSESTQRLSAPLKAIEPVAGARADLVRVRDGTEQAMAASVARVRLDRAMTPCLAAWRRFAYITETLSA